LVANAILWTAHIDVPESGVSVEPIEVAKLLENQDETVPANFNPTGVSKQFGIPAGAPVGAKSPGKILFSSKTVTSQTSRHRIDVDVDVSGVKKLFLIVTPG
jgi:hypothetical protein